MLHPSSPATQSLFSPNSLPHLPKPNPVRPNLPRQRPLPLTPHLLPAPTTLRRIRRPRRRIVRRPVRHHLHLNRAIPLDQSRLRRPLGQIPAPHTHLRLARRHVHPRYYSFKHLQRDHGLVERHLVPGFVDTDECEVVGLLDLAVHDAVGGGDVGVAGGREVRRVDLVGHDLAAEPVAVVVRVARVHDHGQVGGDQGGHVGDDGQHAGVVTRGAEGAADRDGVIAAGKSC